MHLDCASCPVRDNPALAHRCSDCLVTALYSLPAPGSRPARPELALDSAEQRAVGRLVAAGLVQAGEAAALAAVADPVVARVG